MNMIDRLVQSSIPYKLGIFISALQNMFPSRAFREKGKEDGVAIDEEYNKSSHAK